MHTMYFIALQWTQSPKKLTRWQVYEPTFFCSEGGNDDHCATPPELVLILDTMNFVFEIEFESRRGGGVAS
jgi:hypothetical protein